MPTGYTADVVDGKLSDFPIFALRCARQFGATIMQRDDPMSDLPKHREVSTYNIEALASARARAQQLATMTPDEAAVECRTAFDKRIAEIEESHQRANAVRERCEAMLASVRAWVPPTHEHMALKTFMIEQLTETIKFDAETYLEPLEAMLPDRWLREQQKIAQRDIEYHERAIREDEERCRKSNEWIDTLYASLPSQPGGAR